VVEPGIVELYASKTDSFTDSAPYGVPGPVIRYLVEIFNLGAVAAEGVRFAPRGDPATALLPESIEVDGGGEVFLDTAGFRVRWDRIEPGSVVTVVFAVEVRQPIPPDLFEVSCQGFLRGENFPQIPTDDPDTAEKQDPTVTDLRGTIDVPVIEIPTLSGIGLGLFVALLGAACLRALRKRPRAPVLGMVALSLLVPLRAEAGCGDNSPATPVPECRSAEGAELPCTDPEAVRLWPAALRPGLPGETLPPDRDSTQWTSTTIPGALSGHELFQSLAIDGDYVYVAYNAGVQVWDVGGIHAEDPEKVAAADGWRGDFFAFPAIGENDFYIDDVGVAEGFGGGRLVGLAGKESAGFTWWLHRDGQFVQLYQDLGNDSRQVRVVARNGNVFGVTAGPTSLDVYHGSLAQLFFDSCPPEIPPELCVCLDDSGSACPGIFVGSLPDELPGLYLDVLLREERLYVAVSGGSGLPVRLWEVDPLAPASAVLRFSGLSGGAQGLAFVELGSQVYLAAAIREATAWYLRIYDALACLDEDGCASLGPPLYSQEVSPLAVQRLLTVSESGGRPFLYYGVDLIDLEGEGEELLLDLGDLPAEIRELTADGGSYVDSCSLRPVDYWGDYYPRNAQGLRNVRPKVGRFRGPFFYRAAYGIFDVHVREDAWTVFVDGFESGNVAAWTALAGD
jgi:hypothetical protein